MLMNQEMGLLIYWLKELYSCYSVVTSLSSLRLYCREGEEREECESHSRSLHSSSRSSSCSLHSSSCSLRSSSPFSHSTIFTLLLLHITSQVLYARECSHPSAPL